MRVHAAGLVLSRQQDDEANRSSGQLVRDVRVELVLIVDVANELDHAALPRLRDEVPGSLNIERATFVACVAPKLSRSMREGLRQKPGRLLGEVDEFRHHRLESVEDLARSQVWRACAGRLLEQDAHDPFGVVPPVIEEKLAWRLRHDLIVVEERCGKSRTLCVTIRSAPPCTAAART